MSLPTVTVLMNKSGNDVACSSPTGDDNFIPLQAADRLVWRDTQQMDQDLLTGPKYPVVKQPSTDIEAPKTFLMDDSLGKYVQIPLAGTSSGGQQGGDKRYPFAAYVDGPTAGIPYLEAWSNAQHTADNGYFLGGGNATVSLLKAIATTNGTPGSAAWPGTPLAGTVSRIALDVAALAGAKFLYWNMKMVVPYSFSAAQSSAYVLSMRILYS